MVGGWGFFWVFFVVFRVQSCSVGRLLCVFTSTFQPGEDMPKYHREGCSGWYFCLRLKAEVLQVLCDSMVGSFTAHFFQDPRRVLFFWRSTCTPANRPSLHSGRARRPSRTWQDRSLPPHRSPDTHTYVHTRARAHTHTLPLRARAYAKPSGSGRRSAPRRIRPSPGPRDLNT